MQLRPCYVCYNQRTKLSVPEAIVLFARYVGLLEPCAMDWFHVQHHGRHQARKIPRKKLVTCGVKGLRKFSADSCFTRPRTARYAHCALLYRTQEDTARDTLINSQMICTAQVKLATAVRRAVSMHVYVVHVSQWDAGITRSTAQPACREAHLSRAKLQSTLCCAGWQRLTPS